MHRRAAIRAAVVAAVTGLPTTADRVYVSRVYASQLEELPNLTVATPQDQTEPDAGSMRSPYQVARELTVLVEARARGNTFADALDQIALEVESALMADPELGGVCEFLELIATETGETGELEQPVGVLVLEFLCRYHVAATDPQ